MVNIPKPERQLNLYIALKATRRHLPAETIRTSVVGYEGCATDEAFKKMFERDKSELRDMGITIEVHKGAFDEVEGYKVLESESLLPAISFTNAESTAIALASRLWSSGGMANAAQGALLKLAAGGVQIDQDLPSIVAPVSSRTMGSELVISALLAAADAGQVVEFDHRTPGSSTVMRRHVEPWGVRTWRGKWYLVGHDLDRGAVRTFRVSRIGSDVLGVGKKGAVQRPADVDLAAIIIAATKGDETSGSAKVWVAQGRGRELRRIARSITPADGGDLIEADFSGLDSFTRLITSLGPDAVVHEPEELRSAVIARLTGVANS